MAPVKQEEIGVTALKLSALICGILLAAYEYLVHTNVHNSAQNSENPDRIIAFIGVILVFGQVWIAARQTAISREQNVILARQTAISEQAMTVNLRPQVYVKNVTFVVMDEGRVVNYVQAIVEIGVLGATAPSFSLWSEEVHYEKIPDPLDALNGKIGPISGDPGIPIRRDASLEVTEEMKSDILSKKLKRFYLVGTVWYEDVFGNATWFQYCYSSMIQGGQGRAHGGERYNWRRQRKPE